MNLLVIHALRQCYYVSDVPLFAKKFNFSGNFLREIRQWGELSV